MTAISVTRLSPADFTDRVPALAELLVDAVDNGASLGFAAPLAPREAEAWWHTRTDAVASGTLLVWTAEYHGTTVGTVSLALSPWHNGRHRADLLKLIVHGKARGRGIARRLLAEAEHHAAANGRTLLMLDTEADSPADHLYRSEGWSAHGTVPDFAEDAHGTLRACTFFHKHLTPTEA